MLIPQECQDLIGRLHRRKRRVSRLGGGRVISYTVDPNFRAIWYGTSKLTANAIWFGAMISPMSL